MFKSKILISRPIFCIALISLINFFICPYAVAGDLVLPAPGVMVHLSPSFDPPILKGIKVHPDNPFQFDFILDQGDNFIARSPAKGGTTEQSFIKQEATKLIKYFLASLTIPEEDLWVNLSPYEKDRIIPNSFGLTQMGRDLLAEDYMLKQITASLIYPEDEIGKKFWERIYEEAAKRYGTTNIPVNTFNKVWIVPEKAVVYENAKAGTAYVVEAKLKVMLEQDYLSLEKHNGIANPSSVIASKAKQSFSTNKNDINALGSQIVREIVIPELTKEVNGNKNFAQLRQVYNSLILATWYKKKIKDSILAQVYEDKKKVAGVGYQNSSNIEAIYQRYLQAFKKGVYNYIKEDIDPATQATIPRKYFSGGVTCVALGTTLEEVTSDIPSAAMVGKDRAMQVRVNAQPIDSEDPLKGKKVAFRMGKIVHEAGLMRGYLKIDGNPLEIESLQEASSFFLFEYGGKLINVNFNFLSTKKSKQDDLKILESRLDALHKLKIAPKLLGSGLIQGKYPYLVMQAQGKNMEQGGRLKPGQIESVRNLIEQLIVNKWMVTGFSPSDVIWDEDQGALFVSFDQARQGSGPVWDKDRIINFYLQAYDNEKEKWEEIDPGHEIYEFILGLKGHVIVAAVAQPNKVREELKEFGFSFDGGKVSWDPANNKHKDWKPMTEWSPKKGQPDIKQISELTSIEVEDMVPFVEASHSLFLAITDIERVRQPVVIKQYRDSLGRHGYYAMAFVPGEPRQFFKVTAQEAGGQISSQLIAQRKAITKYFIGQGVAPPEEFIYTPDGHVVPIDAEHLYSDDRQFPNEEPAKEYIFSQLGGPKFYGLVKLKPVDKDTAMTSELERAKYTIELNLYKIRKIATDDLHSDVEKESEISDQWGEVKGALSNIGTTQAIGLRDFLEQSLKKDPLCFKEDDKWIRVLGILENAEIFEEPIKLLLKELGGVRVIASAKQRAVVLKIMYDNLEKWLRGPRIEAIRIISSDSTDGVPVNIRRLLILSYVREVFGEDVTITDKFGDGGLYIIPSEDMFLKNIAERLKDLHERAQRDVEVLGKSSYSVESFLGNTPAAFGSAYAMGNIKIVKGALSGSMRLDMLRQGHYASVYVSYDPVSRGDKTVYSKTDQVTDESPKVVKVTLKDAQGNDKVVKVDISLTPGRLVSFQEEGALTDDGRIILTYSEKEPTIPGERSPVDGAMAANGGIDLTPANMNLQTQNVGEGIKFHLDPAQLAQLQNASGFVPVIVNIQPLKSLPEFLGLNQPQASTQ